MRRIAVIRLGAMGDIVLATAAIGALARRYPDAGIDFICKRDFAGLLAHDPRLARVIPFDHRGRHRGLRGLLSFLHDLPRERYDCVVDLQANARSRAIMRCLRAGRRVEWPKRGLRRRLLVRGIGRKRKAPGVVERYLSALAPLGVTGEVAPKLFPRPDPGVALPRRPFIAIAPGAHWQTKRWPAERFAELAAAIGNATWDIVLVGGEGDREACAAVAAGAPFPVLDLCGRLDLTQLVTVLSKAALLVCNDTGAMHVAEAAGTPVIALFGPTVRGFGFAPWREESAVIERDLSCRPCSVHGSARCPRGHFRCLRGIPTAQVQSAIRPLLQKHLGRLMI
ncbi:MAG: glycosyltransferase family 9 protein [Candidatus Edwardsbacteria bacterium]|jgi:heptosyltransferase-2|nr:glycosyltransferase family 9 protein [Candidatus Edwardsbacteria bacterium]